MITKATIAILVAASAFAVRADAQTLQPADTTPVSATVAVDAAQTVRSFDPKRLGGTNLALWNAKTAFSNPTTLKWIASAKPGLIRIPGGSWSDVTYWNGNGVRDASGKLDTTKIGPDGYPAVDYSAYAPSFTADSKTLAPSTAFSGNVDVKTLHDFVKAVGSNPLVCVNAGTGRPLDAAEWVKWANLTMHYGAHYWEIGNELDGGWEAGNTIPKTNRKLTGDIYAKRFHDFAVAMRAVDPTIAIGGATTGIQDGSFTETMLKYTGDDVDFVSIHTYPSIGGMTGDQALTALERTLAGEVANARKFIWL